MLAFNLLETVRFNLPYRPVESIFRVNKIGIVCLGLIEEKAVFKDIQS